MSSKLRKDLPSVPTREWGRREIAIFDLHRADYRKAVQTATNFYGDRAFIADGKAADYNGFNKLLVMMVEQGAKVAQLLMKYETHPNDNTFRIPRSIDAITAFYVPTDIRWLEVLANNQSIGKFWGQYAEPNLEDILEESWQIPRSKDASYLEYILWVSRQGKIGFAHNQEEEIELDGVRYKRLIFIQPMIPYVQCAYAEIYIVTSSPCTVYLEVSVAQGDLRRKLTSDEMTGWIDDLEARLPLIKFSGGSISNLYYSKRDDRLQELPALEIFDAEQIPTLDLPAVDLGDGVPDYGLV